MPTNTADIRPYLTSAYSDEELITLCSDYFRDVYENFASGMTKGQKIQLLLDHCQRRERISNLLAALERDRPDQYRKRFGPAAAETHAAAEPNTAQPSLKRDPRQVFISHAHEDTEFAPRLAADLAARGWRTWIAPDSIRAGEKWVEAINRGLEECGVFVVSLTPAAVGSKWVADETNAAKEMQQEGELRFIPLGVSDCRVPPLWRVHQRISFTGAYSNGLAALLAELEGASGQPEAQRPPEPIVGMKAEQRATSRSEVRTAAQAPASPPAVPKAAPEASRPVTASPDLLIIESPVPLELVRVPAGEFLMGSDPTQDKQAQDYESPQHRVCMPEFYIARVPVTNEQYAIFVKATRWVAPEYWQGGQIPVGKENSPVVYVSWQDAVALCQWLSEASGRAVRLPTEAEWEKAARGADGRIWPWGNQQPTERLCNFDMKVKDTTPVGRYPDGASPCGALDMAGNVWEWALSLYRPYPYEEQDGRNSLAAAGTRRVLRGGAYPNNAWDVRCAARNWNLSSSRSGFIGFRVIASTVS